jgi:hypothetical protein
VSDRRIIITLGATTMPLKLSIAMSRKVGEPNYGSRGATVGLEMELDTRLVDQPLELHERIAGLFRLATESVDRELIGHGAEGSQHTGSNGATTGHEHQVRPATANQIRAIHAIANRQNLDLTAELRSWFGVYRADYLTLEQASVLIDAIKPLANGTASHQDGS